MSNAMRNSRLMVPAPGPRRRSPAKTHQASMYRKLAASRRRDAVLRARQLGLI